MKIVIFAGPPSSGKTSVIKYLLKRIKKVAYFKMDVQYTIDDEVIGKLGIPTKKLYSGELCPDHCFTMVVKEVIEWAKKKKAEYLFIETAGLCFRCSPYLTNTLGVVVLGAPSGMNLPFKIGPMLSLADIAVIAKVDLISQAEKEVMIERIKKNRGVKTIIGVDALRGINLETLVQKIKQFKPKSNNYQLRGIAPIGVCTLCVGKKEIGWENHNGVLRKLEGEMFFRGE